MPGLGRRVPIGGGEEVAVVAPLMSVQGDDGVFEATKEDLEVALRNALRLAGCTYDELADQARRGTFRSPAARRAWFVVSSLVD
jgi:hypothetical protein